MSLSCPVDLDVLMLHREVTAMYASVAAAPDGPFHFHRGAEYAARTLGYEDVRVVDRFDCFAGTTKERTARRHRVIGVNLSAIKSERR